MFQCPRIYATYFLLGVPLGFYIGYLFYSPAFEPPFPPHITCLVIINSKSLNHVNASWKTWLPKCDHQIIVKYERKSRWAEEVKSEEQCERTNVINISSDNGWGALCQSLHLVSRHTDWLILVPDSTLVFVENLRQYLRHRHPQDAIYMGHPIHHYLGDYNVLSAGIVLSYGALTRLRDKFRNRETCEHGEKYWKNEDMVLGAQLRKLGVFVEDTRDHMGRSRFHGFNVNVLLKPGPTFRQTDYFRKSVYPVKEGPDCCSLYLITIDTSDGDQKLWHFFLAYGIGKAGIPPPPRLLSPASTEGAWVKALRDIGYVGPVDNLTSEEYYEIWMNHISPQELASKISRLKEFS